MLISSLPEAILYLIYNNLVLKTEPHTYLLGPLVLRITYTYRG